jgi:hypothetical protein
MKLGDLVWLVFPYVENELVIYIGPDSPLTSRRAKVFWDGDVASVPNHQVEKYDETG